MGSISLACKGFIDFKEVKTLRITNSMLVRNMMGNLNKNLRRMEKFQQQFQSGKMFLLPSDNPIGVSKSLKLYTDKSKIEQYKTNLRDATSWLSTTEDSLAHMKEVLGRTRDLIMQASNGTNSEQETKAIAAEVKELKGQLIQVANSAHAGRTLFTGFKTDKKLLDENGKYLIDLTAKGPDKEISVYNVGVSEDIEVNIVGIRLFGKVGAIDNFEAESVKVADGDESSIIKFFNDLEKNLLDGDTEAVGNRMGEVDSIIQNTLNVRAELGAKTNRLDMTLKRMESDSLNYTRLLSENEDADMAEVITNFKMAESVYLASMSAGSRIIQPTLVDFLR